MIFLVFRIFLIYSRSPSFFFLLASCLSVLATLNYMRSGDLPSFLSVMVTFNLREEWILSVDSGFGEFSLCTAPR
jgi:hypothetical protein